MDNFKHDTIKIKKETSQRKNSLNNTSEDLKTRSITPHIQNTKEITLEDVKIKILKAPEEIKNNDLQSKEIN